ncbi:Exosome complex component RRP43 [Dinochytrium kinnereticum]|nr:Exosome complex component RRP43 [Dinochytrium kinnereticum]
MDEQDLPKPDDEAFVLDPDTFQKVHPVEFHRRFLSQGIRTDGRSLHQFRSIRINSGSIGSAVGSAMVRLGETTCLCGIKAEVSIPNTNNPTSGFLVPNVDFPPICSPNFKPGPPSPFVQSVSEMINSVLQSSNVLDLEELCISKGRAVWVIYADVIFLNYEGNAIDAALAALMAALRSTKLPKVEYKEEDGSIREVPGDFTTLNLRRMPVSSTFGVFESLEDAKIMADPTEEEGCVVSASVTVVLDSLTGCICGVFKPGGFALDRSKINECIGDAKKRAVIVRKMIEEPLV